MKNYPEELLKLALKMVCLVHPFWSSQQAWSSESWKTYFCDSIFKLVFFIFVRSSLKHVLKRLFCLKLIQNLEWPTLIYNESVKLESISQDFFRTKLL